MIKIGVLTTVWKRPYLTLHHMRWMASFIAKCRNMGLDIVPFYVLSKDDPYLEESQQRARHYDFYNAVIPSGVPLSIKTQTGLSLFADREEFDWLMHLDSDEFLSPGLIKKWRSIMVSDIGPKWFGSTGCFFLDIKTWKGYEFKGYPDHPVKNGGTCIHRSILEQMNWMLWTKPLEKGLNIHERKNIEKATGLDLKPVITQHWYGVVEVKGTEKAIHDLDWFRRWDLIKELTEGALMDLRVTHSHFNEL